MAKGIITTQYLSDIADAIRAKLGTNYYRISSTHANTKAASFVAMSFKATSGANLIITADEPIE